MFKLFLISLLFFLGCTEVKEKKSYDAKALLETKCASCHNLDMPPKLSDDALAPPMMAVAFHVHSLIEVADDTRRTSSAVAFVVDYVLNPSVEKSFCDKESLKQYGLMPSQKEHTNKDELTVIAKYMFEHYTQENLSTIQKNIDRLNALPAGEKIALEYKCFACHKKNKKIIGPSFEDIAQRYKKDVTKIKESIKNGNKGQWKNSNGAIMPAFKKIPQEDLETLSRWVLNTKS